MNLLSKYNFDELVKGLDENRLAGYISTQIQGALTLYNYTQACVSEKYWNDFTLSARGLILDHYNKAIVARVMPKFFNWGEQSSDVPNIKDYLVQEKVDGSCIMMWWYQGSWHFSTRGSFQSDQALIATQHFKDNPIPEEFLLTGFTYIWELIGPSNRIVVPYQKDELVFLTAFQGGDGNEITPEGFKWRKEIIDSVPGYRTTKLYDFNHFDDILALAKTLEYTEEGWVLYSPQTGHRVKMKGDAYCALHRLVSRITPLGVYDLIMSGADLDETRQNLPEEFQRDFDAIASILMDHVKYEIYSHKPLFESIKDLSRKDFALHIKETNRIQSLWQEDTYNMSLLFLMYDRKTDAELQKFVLKTQRPTGNVLPGFVASTNMNRFATEE